jgi:hypothetical protein
VGIPVKHLWKIHNSTRAKDFLTDELGPGLRYTIDVRATLVHTLDSLRLHRAKRIRHRLICFRRKEYWGWMPKSAKWHVLLCNMRTRNPGEDDCDQYIWIK